jgi:hypothetical protein
MKIGLIILLSLLPVTRAFCQYPYIINAELHPTNPADTDSVFLISKVALNTHGYRLESQVEINGDTINVQNCYRESPLFAPIYVFDTTYIGIHSDGNYVVVFTAYSSSALIPNCDYTDTNQVILGLTVEIDEIILSNDRELIRQLDLSGRESKDVPNTILVRFYNDGTTEKVFIVE